MLLLLGIEVSCLHSVLRMLYANVGGMRLWLRVREIAHFRADLTIFTEFCA